MTHEDRLLQEVAYLAQRFGWSLDELLDIEHGLRRRFIDLTAELDDSPITAEG